MKAKEIMKKVLMIVAVMGFITIPCAVQASETETLCSGESDEVKLDLATGTVRTAADVETLTYSTEWDGGSEVTLAVNGTTLASGLADSGIYDWTPSDGGLITLTHTTTTSGGDVMLTALFIAPYQVGEDAWAIVTNGVCTIFGTGATWAKSEWPGENHPLAAYSTEIMNVVVQNGVTGLGSQMFENFRYITEVSLAASVESVGAKVFHKCYSLTNVTSAATTAMNIGNGAFMRCNSLETMAFAVNPNWDEQSFKIQAAIRMEGDTPVVYAIPSITIGGEAPRVWGKVKLTDANWTDITDLTPAAKRDYHFFKLEM